MTQICYSLDEAAQKLNLSETVLVRLSQYFKVPAAAYEEVGYLSFKGDLTFSEPDLAFFRQVKECLVAGDTLEQAKQKVHYGPPVKASRQAKASVNVPDKAAQGPAPQVEPLGGLREIQDRAPYQKAAERDFARYKNAHRPAISRVFENMVKEVNAAVAPTKKVLLPDAKPMRQKVDMPGQKVQPAASEKLLPFSRQYKWRDAKRESVSVPVDLKQAENKASWEAAGREMGWDKLIGDAIRQPRLLSPQLTAAAVLLREQAVQHRQKNPPSVS